MAKLPFTKEEIEQIRAAASATWDYVASDAYQLEGFRGTIAEKAELAMDASRAETIGKLDSALAKRLYALPWKDIVKLVAPALR